MTEQAPSEVGDPARSIAGTDCLPLAAGVVPGGQLGSSCDGGTDLLPFVNEVGLLDCDRMEPDLEEGGVAEGEGEESGFSLEATSTPIRQPTDTSRGTRSSFCGQAQGKVIARLCYGSYKHVYTLSYIPDSAEPYPVVSC